MLIHWMVTIYIHVDCLSSLYYLITMVISSNLSSSQNIQNIFGEFTRNEILVLPRNSYLWHYMEECILHM